MKKIYLGGDSACTIHNEKNTMELFVKNQSGYELTKNYSEADIIVIIDTCMATYNHLLSGFNYIEKVLDNKKDNAKVIVSGCFANGVKFDLSKEQKDILNKVNIIAPEKVTEHVARLIGLDLNEDLLNDCRLPFSLDYNRIFVSPVSGCLNHCSFCKTNYMNFPLQSVSMEQLSRFSLDINELSERGLDCNYIGINSSNLSLYGVDLYGFQNAHEAIKVLTSAKPVVFAGVGALINWYPELINEILNNHKIKKIFTSLESGSDRIYNLMNRPISLDEFKRTIKTIRTERPDILINTEIICGYPTETIDDLKKTIDVLYELDINPQCIHPYEDSHCIPSSKLVQHSFGYCVESAYYCDDRLTNLKDKFNNVVEDSEMLIFGKNPQKRFYNVMLIDGNIRSVNFDQMDKQYNVGDITPPKSFKKYIKKPRHN